VVAHLEWPLMTGEPTATGEDPDAAPQAILSAHDAADVQQGGFAAAGMQ
jgi:hypothetical protein